MKYKIPDLLRPRKPAPPATTPPKPTTPTTPARPSSPSRRPSRPTVAPVEEPPNEFGKTLESLLGNKFKGTKVSEEEIYAALVVHQIKQKYGERDAKDWTALFKFSMTDKPKGESREASAERAANDVMDEFFGKNSIIIPAAEAKKIKNTAFRLAQLDNRTDQLWDKFGGDPENTVAVTSFARAQRLVQQRLDAENQPSSAGVRRSAKAKKLSKVG
jgi:hypothetical protein